MKKLLCAILSLSLLVAAFCFAGVSASASESASDEDYPIVSNGKEVIQNPTTYCNPISLTHASNRVSRGGEPVVTIFNDDYYLFVSMQRGYWWSHDFVDWTYVESDSLVPGIIGVVEIDGKLYCYAGNETSEVKVTDDPKSGVWTSVGHLSAYHNDGTPTGGYADASMLYDEETGRLFMYYGCSQILGTRCVEIDKNTWQEIGEPVVCLWPDPHNHGWETMYLDDLIYPMFDYYKDYRTEGYGWTEGGHPLKYNGKYYLLYSSIGLEFYSYSQGVYVADDPMGPFEYLEDNPLTMKTTGVAPGAGHGSFFVDKNNQVWTICMVGYALDGGSGKTLMNLFPSGVDADNVMYGLEEYGDFPQYLPGVVEDPKEHYTGWTLLTLDKKVEVSSELENCYAAYAVDEDSKNYWCAETGDAGEYITVDLGEVCDIRALQVLWDQNGASFPSGSPFGAPANDRYHCYTIEVSDDNENWNLIVDKSDNPQDLWSDYIELPEPVNARFVKLTNVFTPDEGKFAVKALRAFGNPEQSTFTKVENVKVVRSELDRRNAHLLWDEVPGADGYLVRYGIAPDKLYNSYIVYWDSCLDIPSLNVNPEYYFEVEAFSSGTPRYVENTFETRGRGAELEVLKDGSKEEGCRVMTFETYGRDEVYVLDDITPGTYDIRMGMHIFGPIELTEEELIGTGDDPTVEELNSSMTFGNGTTRWGTIEVRVFPGETSGRIEVTFKYDK